MYTKAHKITTHTNCRICAYRLDLKEDTDIIRGLLVGDIAIDRESITLRCV